MQCSDLKVAENESNIVIEGRGPVSAGAVPLDDGITGSLQHIAEALKHDKNQRHERRIEFRHQLDRTGIDPGRRDSRRSPPSVQTAASRNLKTSAHTTRPPCGGGAKISSATSRRCVHSVIPIVSSACGSSICAIARADSRNGYSAMSRCCWRNPITGVYRASQHTKRVGVAIQQPSLGNEHFLVRKPFLIMIAQQTGLFRSCPLLRQGRSGVTAEAAGNQTRVLGTANDR